MEETTNKKLSFEEMPAALERMMDDISAIKSKVLGDIAPGNIRSNRIPVDIDRACEIVGKAKNTIYRYTSQGLIPHCKVGKTLYFFEEDLLAWVKQNSCDTLDERIVRSNSNIVPLTGRRE